MIVLLSTDQLRRLGEPMRLLGEILDACPGVSPIPLAAQKFCGADRSKPTVYRLLRDLADAGVIGLNQDARPWEITILTCSGEFADWFGRGGNAAAHAYPGFYPAQYELLREAFPGLPVAGFDQICKESLLSAALATPEPIRSSGILGWVKSALAKAKADGSAEAAPHKRPLRTGEVEVFGLRCQGPTTQAEIDRYWAEIEKAKRQRRESENAANN